MPASEGASRRSGRALKKAGRRPNRAKAASRRSGTAKVPRRSGGSLHDASLRRHPVKLGRNKTGKK